MKVGKAPIYDKKASFTFVSTPFILYLLLLFQNKRVAKTMVVSLRHLGNPRPVSASRSCAVVRYEAPKFATDAFSLLQQFNTTGGQAAW